MEGLVGYIAEAANLGNMLSAGDHQGGWGTDIVRYDDDFDETTGLNGVRFGHWKGGRRKPGTERECGGSACMGPAFR